MSVASSVAIALAERIERTAGARAGLVAWRRLAQTSTDGELRGTALIAALRCALALRDRDGLSELAALWKTVDRGVWDASITKLCKEMVRAGLEPLAIELARVEALRHRTARTLYLYARCLDVDRTSDIAVVAAAFRDAIDRSVNEGAKDIELASRVRRAGILSASWSTMSEALEEAQRVDLARASGGARLEIARVLLLSPSRFVRAGAIAALDGIVTSEDDAALAARALEVVARWIDDAGSASTPLELDRLVALFGRARALALAPGATAIVASIDRAVRAPATIVEVPRTEPSLAAIQSRARDILRGRFEVARDGAQTPPDDRAERRAFRYGEILDAVAALRDRAPSRAAAALRGLTAAEVAGEAVPREVMTVAHAAVVSDDRDLREVAARLIALRLRRPTAPPPQGFTALADTLASLGMADLADIARRAAAVVKEPGAVDTLGTLLARSGWALSREGDREGAVLRLREAKRLLTGT